MSLIINPLVERRSILLKHTHKVSSEYFHHIASQAENEKGKKLNSTLVPSTK
jgi:hypothetical protein